MSPHFRDSLFAPRWVVVGCSPDAGLVHTSLSGDQSWGTSRLVVPTLTSNGRRCDRDADAHTPHDIRFLPCCTAVAWVVRTATPRRSCGLSTDALTVIYDTPFHLARSQHRSPPLACTHVYLMTHTPFRFSEVAFYSLSLFLLFSPWVVFWTGGPWASKSKYAGDKECNSGVMLASHPQGLLAVLTELKKSKRVVLARFLRNPLL